MDIINGKNYILSNEYGIQYVVTNSVTNYKMYVVRSCDIDIENKSEEFYTIHLDLDSRFFAQPISADALATSLMCGWSGKHINLFKLTEEELKCQHFFQ